METENQSGIPTLAYFAYGKFDRLVLCMRFVGIHGARKGTRAIMHRLVQHGIGHKVTYHRAEPNTGEYEVDIAFCKDVTERQVWTVITKPPTTNRGVTKSE